MSDGGAEGGVAIVGGGVSGLAAAYRLERLGARDVTLFEAADRLGGNVRTQWAGGFVLDAGPDSWVTTKPEAGALARELDLAGEIVETVPENRRVYVALGRELHALPEGLVLGVPTRLGPLARTPLFGWDAKLRMLLEPLVPRRAWHDGEDESISAFFTRRFGEELSDRLAAPLLGGIFAGDASDLSIRATFPQIVEMERVHGSLVRAMRSARPRGSGSVFESLEGGMQRLVERLAESLDRTVVRLGHGVRAVEHDGTRFRVDGEPFRGVILTAPAWALAGAVRGLDAELGRRLEELRYATTATVLLGLLRADVPHPLDATGFLVPRSLARPILACTFVSSKWARRAPPGYALLRAFFEGKAAHRTDRELEEVAVSELSRFLGPLGQPRLVRVFRHVRANPQPVIGHLERMRAIGALLERHPGLHLAGNGYDGSGLADCIRQADRAARAVMG